MKTAVLQSLVTAMRRDEDLILLILPNPRAVELARRLVAPSPKACSVSASECHEVADALLAVHDQRGPGSIGLVALYRHADALLDLTATCEAICNGVANGISFGEMLLLVARMDSKLAAVHAVEPSETDELP